MKLLRLIPVMVLGFSGALVGAGAASASPAPPHNASHSYTCTGSNGGVVPPGTYDSVTITGVCSMPAGTIDVRGNLTVAPGALLDAVTSGDPVANPLVPATLWVGGNVWVGRGAVLFLGCSPNISCPMAITDDHIGGSLTATGALGVVVHSTSIGGDFSILGGGGGVVGGVATGVCDGNPAAVPPVPAPVPPLWLADPSLANGEGPGMPLPVYSDVEDNVIGGNFTVAGLRTCWLGGLRNRVGGNTNFSANVMGDPDGMEMANNLVSGSLTCLANDPAVQFGDSGAAPNIVGSYGIGQCGFKVKTLNPAAEAMAGPGVEENIAVPSWSLGTFTGIHTQTSNVATLPLATTTSGDSLVAELNNVVFTGSGLNGTATAVYPPTSSSPLGSTGEAVLATVHGDGSETFTAIDNCSCSFDGQSGSVTIRAYGTTSADGTIRGTFLVVSGGGPTSGDLSTLAGFGTFSSWGQPAGSLRIVEHLRIT
jgi:hypothetical protein